MHLGFLTSEYPHPRSNLAAGIGTSIKNMVSELVKKGIEISVFVYGQTEDAIFIEDGIKFHLIGQRKFKMFGWYLHRKTIQHYLNKYISSDKIEAIEAPDWTGITAFMKLNCALVIRMHGSDGYFCRLEGRPQKTKNFWFEKLALKGADHLLSVSKFTAEKTAVIFNLKKEIEVIPNSVNVERFSPSPDQQHQGTILYFGSLIRKKGVLELPEIFNRLVQENSTLKLKIAGRDVFDKITGRSTKELMLEKFSAEAAAKVIWLGNLQYEEILGEVAQSHLVVLPSFAEALPMTWIEAMAMEKALVTSDIGWAKEVMVDGVTGFTVNPKDHTLFAERILHLLKNPELALKMGKAAREKVIIKFSTEVVVKQYIKYMKKILPKPERKKINI